METHGGGPQRERGRPMRPKGIAQGELLRLFRQTGVQATHYRYPCTA